MGLILIVILVILLVGAFPSWPYSRRWGPGPSGLLGIVLIILVIFFLFGHRF